jgi:hypothetical protein
MQKIKSLVEGTTCVHYYVFDGSYLLVCYHFDKRQQASTVVCIWVGSYAVECTPSLRSNSILGERLYSFSYTIIEIYVVTTSLYSDMASWLVQCASVLG